MESLVVKESQWRDLNSWPFPYQGNALPLSYIGKKKERETGFEPATFSLEGWRSTNWATLAFRTELQRKTVLVIRCKDKNFSLLFYKIWVGRAGFEPAKLKNNRFTVCPRWPLEYLPFSMIVFTKLACEFSYCNLNNFLFFKLRADGGTRTHDLLITNQLL